ncbi:MarR family winged helix-turn-helix transcriptional regulator [Neptuniibacter caesariensis]|uniref:Probable regulatory protein, MarR family protein n=1 Tax=Neptuniibacter caesariensis TaxID=207954 RepID=A0A7U8C4Y1_NEPCE|nr:MarR family transcriptional regulator [Neptuniibacter caesariensis]EAR61650.1 probable regulatory protein, MarR family protein [Neptuniibacter caesariensis]
MADKKMDAVDLIVDQWKNERPELNSELMGIPGRIKRSSALVQHKLEKTFAEYGLNYWEFDVLATLRRAGSLYSLAPTALFSTLMVTSGTMTHRLKGLEKRGLIARTANPEDARSMLVELTEEGFQLIDKAVTAHTENLERILSPLTEDEQQQLDNALRKILSLLEDA